jgi:integrase
MGGVRMSGFSDGRYSESGQVPPKSSCYFCPAMKPQELHDLTQEKLKRIVVIEARAKPRLTDIDGLWRKPVKGMRGATPRPGRKTKATSREEADAVVAAAKIDEIEVLSSIMNGRRMTCARVYDEWVEWRKLSKAPNTIQAQAYMVARFLNENNLGGHFVSEVTELHVDSFVNPPDEDISAVTRKTRLAAVKSYLSYAESKAYRFGTPARLVSINHRLLTREQKEQKKRVPFTHEEYEKVMARAKGFQRYATAISYWAGLRLSDCANIEWSCIRENEIITWTRKRNARVALPIGDPLIGGGLLGLIILEMMDNIKPTKTPFIFPAEAALINDPSTQTQVSAGFVRLFKAAGIEDKTFHCLRHSFATRLSKAGKTEEEIGTLIGHADVKTTRGYIHYLASPNCASPSFSTRWIS